jgi:NAD(P)-dependent dehydrogenase (short-subunit alcohol dehydrogenase family)
VTPYSDAVEEAGRTCVFLASDDSRFISGEVIAVTGGLL